MDVPDATPTFFTNLSVQSRTAKTATYMALTVVCDALFVRPITSQQTQYSRGGRTQVYRVFVVYQRKYISIIVPFMLFLANVGEMLLIQYARAWWLIR